MDFDEEEMRGGVEEIDVEEVELMTQLPKYILPQKAIAKVSKDLDNTKFMVSMPLLSENVVLEGNFLTHIPILNMEDWE